MPTFSAKKLLDELRLYPNAQSYIVGFSGGADSTALLHALIHIQQHLQPPVSAVHVNHRLHAHADTWQAFCEQFCEQHQIKLTCLTIELNHQSGKGLEAEARHLRYEAISNLLVDEATLLTAHHADDQAETLLLNLMRGSGVDGMSAMPEHRPLGNGFLQRPLLGFENIDLVNYLKEHNVNWVDDPSNQYLNHDRNFVRHELIPLLERRWPNVNKRLLLTHRAMTDARMLLERLADEYLEDNTPHQNVLHITPNIFDDPQLFKLITRRWTHQLGTASIPVHRLESLYGQLKNADRTKRIEMSWGDWKVHLYQDKLWLLDNDSVSACASISWPKQADYVDLGSDIALVSFVQTENAEKAGFPASKDLVPFEHLCIAGRRHIKADTIKTGGLSKSLKKLFQAANIPPWLRDSIPLLRYKNEIVAMGDWCFSDSFASWMKQHAVELQWQPEHPLLQFIHNRQHSDES